MEDQNPFQSPQWADKPAAFPSSRLPDSGMVKQVRVVAILMIVQGALELLAGLGATAIAVIMTIAAGEEDFPADVEFVALFPYVYGGLAVLLLTIGGLHIAAGQRNYGYRSRALGLIALGVGLLTVFSCYCAITAVPLAIYGLVVYLNEDVARAFREQESKRQG